MVKRTKRNEIERRVLLERGLSIVLSGMLAMSACGTTMVAFAADGSALTYESQQPEKTVAELLAGDTSSQTPVEDVDIRKDDGTLADTDASEEDVRQNLASEEVNESYSVAFATGDASVDCNGATITGQQAVSVPVEEDLVFTVAPRDGFTVDDVSLQLLSEGVLDVLDPTETAEGAQYTVAVDDLADGMAIVVDTTVIEIEEDASDIDSFADLITPPATGRTPSSTVKDVEKVYDGHPVSVSVNAGEDGSTLLYYTDGMNGWSTENPQFTDAGTYTVLVKTIGQNDSEADVVTAHVTVKPASVVIKVRDAEKTVGNVDPAFEGVIEGLVPGDEIGSVVYYRQNSGVEEVGSYAGALSALVQHRNGNYTYTVEPGSFTIAPYSDTVSSVQMSEPTAPDEQTDGTRIAPVNPKLLAEFAQGGGAQRITEDVVKPIATLMGVVNADPTTIVDDETPLTSFGNDESNGGLTLLWMVLGVLLTAASAVVALLLRRRQQWLMNDELDEALSAGREPRRG